MTVALRDGRTDPKTLEEAWELEQVQPVLIAVQSGVMDDGRAALVPAGDGAALTTQGGASMVGIVPWVSGTLYSEAYDMQDGTLIAWGVSGTWVTGMLSIEVAVPAANGQGLDWHTLRRDDGTAVQTADVQAPTAFRPQAGQFTRLSLIRFKSSEIQTSPTVRVKSAPR